VWTRLVCLIIVATAVTIPNMQSEMPLAYTVAMNNAGQNDILTVKNYDTGASMTEAYSDVEHLNRNTQVRTGSYAADTTVADSSGADAGCPGCGSGGGLEASINSNVIGKAHIAWQSVDPSVSDHGRHPLIGRSVEDLTGVFSIEKFIQLWSDSRPGEISVDWLPCS
jgi:hypothetical protein